MADFSYLVYGVALSISLFKSDEGARVRVMEFLHEITQSGRFPADPSGRVSLGIFSCIV